MVRNTLSLFALFMFVTVSSLTAQSLPFKDGSFQQIQQLSAEKQQPFLIYLFKHNSKEHRKMLRKTWANKQMKKYLATHYQVGRVNVFSGKPDAKLVQKHQVFKLPTTLVFTHEGKLIGKVAGFAAPASFRSILEKHQDFMSKKLGPVEVQKTAPVVTSQARKTAAVPSEDLASVQSTQVPQVAKTYTPPVTQKQARPMPVSRGQSNLHLEVPGMHEFSLNKKKGLDQVKEESLGLLIGSYTSYNQLRQNVSRFQKVWKGRMWVFAEEVNQIPVYKLVLGDYQSREEAEIFANVIYKIDKSNPSILDLKQLLN